MDSLHIDVDQNAALFHGLYDHKNILVRTQEEYLRGCAGGFNVRVQGDNVVLHPRISRTDFDALQDLSLQSADDVLRALLDDMSLLPTHKREKFMVDRAAVWKPMHAGGYRMVLVPRVPKAVDEIDLIRGMPVEVALAKERVIAVPRSELEAREVTRTYQLMQVFNDKSVLDKYQLTSRQIESAKRLAATDSTAASRLLQEAMNASQSEVRVFVKAQAWTKSIKQAVHTVNTFCREYPYVDIDYHIDIIKDTIFMHAPDNENWMVSGPVTHTEQVRALHGLVFREGYVLPSVLLSIECGLLNINLGTKYDVSEPTITYHAGISSSVLVAGISEETARMLPTNVRTQLLQMTDRLNTVKDSEGAVVATAVRVTEDNVLVNNHVLADTEKEMFVGEHKLTPVAQISRDLWVAECPGRCDPWQLRDPVKGEFVILCGMGQSGLYVSPPLKINDVLDGTLMIERHSYVIEGMSGAAIVSLNGLCLLGVHSAAVGNNLLAYRFGSTHLSELIMRDVSLPASGYGDDDEMGRHVMDHFKRHGLLSTFKRTAGSMLDLRRDGVHVGMAVATSDNYIVTTCNVDTPLTTQFSDVPITWSSVSTGVYGAHIPGLAKSSPPFVRAPRVMEKVFVIGWDGSPYIAGQSAVAYVGLDEKSFTIRRFDARYEATGGLVVAWDGAVIGILAYDSGATQVGGGMRCWPLPSTVTPELATPERVLESHFPSLSVVAWPSKLLEEVCSHKSYADAKNVASNKSLASIGRSAVIYHLNRSLREAGIPANTWQDYQTAIMTDSLITDIATRYGFRSIINLAENYTRQLGPADYADVVFALVGATSMVETETVLLSLLQKFKLTFQSSIEDT